MSRGSESWQAYPRIDSSEITPESVWLNRRNLMKAAAAGAGMAAVGEASAQPKALTDLNFTAAPDDTPVKATEDLTPYEAATTYNNFYEFGTEKSDPARYAEAMTTDPWEIKVGGLVNKPGKLHLEDILSGFDLEERIYRFRCVEAWSMVVPWNGFELADLLNMAGVQSSAKYVAFETLYRPEEMRGQRMRVLDWPYVEGLRLDEAMHPLTIMATGIYGRDIPNQNGAPLRLVVPWKYGFKSIKSIVKITLTETEPPTSWNKANPREYGFYSNVNPEVDHPRWSQASERPLGGGLFAKRVPTRMFNGYADDVSDLYSGMDLKTFF